MSMIHASWNQRISINLKSNIALISTPTLCTFSRVQRGYLTRVISVKCLVDLSYPSSDQSKHTFLHENGVIIL